MWGGPHTPSRLLRNLVGRRARKRDFLIHGFLTCVYHFLEDFKKEPKKRNPPGRFGGVHVQVHVFVSIHRAVSSSRHVRGCNFCFLAFFIIFFIVSIRHIFFEPWGRLSRWETHVEKKKRKKEKKRKREKNKRNKRETKEPKKRKTEKKEDTKREFMPSERNVLRSVELYRPAARVSARLAKRRGGCPSLTRPDLGSRVMIASLK